MKRGLNWKLTDNLKRKLFIKNELKRFILKSLGLNTTLPLSYRYFAIFNYSKISRWSSIIQQKNKCIKTGRTWSTVKHAKYSRFIFRRESYNGNIPGFKRASW